MRSELLKSPYLVELGALHLNLSAAEQETISLNEMVGEFSCDFESSSPTLTCCLLGSAKLDFELTCSICLVREVNLLRSAPQVRVHWIKRIRDCPSYKLALIRHTGSWVCQQDDAFLPLNTFIFMLLLAGSWNEFALMNFLSCHFRSGNNIWSRSARMWTHILQQLRVHCRLSVGTWRPKDCELQCEMPTLPPGIEHLGSSRICWRCWTSM